MFLSGGEPTIHPELPQILHSISERFQELEQIFVITNGVVIAESPAYCRDLAESCNDGRLEVYLQFDSLDSESIAKLRGVTGLDEIHSRAIANLAAESVPLSLVCVVKRGVNLDQVASVVRYASTCNNVRGVTFQPIREAGRLESYSRSTDETDLDAVWKSLKLELGDDLKIALDSRSPLSMAVGAVARSDRVVAIREVVDRGGLFGASRREELRIAIVEYSDRRTWMATKSAQALIGVYTSCRLTTISATLGVWLEC